MASFTIHDVPLALDQQLSQRAKLARTSKNQLIKDLLSHCTGLPTASGLQDDYREFCGIWTQADLNEFNQTQVENQQIDSTDW